MWNWRNETFKVGNTEIKYTDVTECRSKFDSNGNPIFDIKTKQGTTHRISGVQAYAFDQKRVIDGCFRKLLNL